MYNINIPLNIFDKCFLYFQKETKKCRALTKYYYCVINFRLQQFLQEKSIRDPYEEIFFYHRLFHYLFLSILYIQLSIVLQFCRMMGW